MISIIFLFIFLTVIGLLVIFRMGNLSARLQKAEEYINNDDYQKAGEIIKEILDRRKDYIPARYLRAQILMRQKQYLMAISELNSIVSVPNYGESVNKVDIHQMLIELYNETRQWEKEISECRILLSINPDNILANHRIGHVLYKQNRYLEAEKYLIKALELDPSLFDCLPLLGISYFYLSQYDKAEEYLLKTIEYSTDYLDAYYCLGMIYKLRKDFETAIEMFEKSKKDDRFSIQSIYSLGEIYYENGMYDKTVKTMEEGLENLKEDNTESLAYRYLLSDCYAKENMIEEAAYQLEKIVKVDPDYQRAKVEYEDYKAILNNENIKMLFTTSMNKLQPIIMEIITSLNYNVVSKIEISNNEFMFKAFNIKQIDNSQILVYFNRTTVEINHRQMIDFYKKIVDENCKKGIYIATSRFSNKAEITAGSRMIELMDPDFLDLKIRSLKIRKPVTE